jgi:hypothetical protein
MAATVAAKNKKIRQEALRDQLSAQKHVEHVIDISKKLHDQHLNLESTAIQALKASADIKLKLINKYLPDLKMQEIQHSGEIQQPIGKVEIEVISADSKDKSD